MQKKRTFLVLGLVVIIVIIALVYGISKSADNLPDANKSRNGKFTFSNSQMSVSYPLELNKQFVGSKLIIKSQDSDDNESLAIYPYLSKDETTTLESIAKGYLKNGKDEVVATSKKKTLNDATALIIVPIDEKLSGTKLTILVEGQDTIWLIDANFSSSESLLATKANDIINSFKLKQ